MPKKPKQKSDLTIIREGLDLSQPEFARRLGVSASMIKKLEEGKRAMSQDLAARILAETGILFAGGNLPNEPFTYSKENQEAWLKEVQFNQKYAEVAARSVFKLVELMLIAAARPSVQKSYQIFNALIQALEKVKLEFQLEKHIEAELRERHSTEAKLYTVRELRANDLLAKMVNFQDNSALKDDETIMLEKTTGWLPTKEIFNILWQHRKLAEEIRNMQNGELTETQKAQLEELEKKIDGEITRFAGS